MRADFPLRLDAEGGRLWVGAGRYLLVRPETLLPLLISPDPGLEERLRQGGRAGGRLAAQGARGRQAAEAVLAFGARIGWGRFEVRWGRPGAEVRLRHSPFAEAARGRAQGPVCHLVCGVLEGVWEVALERPARFEELECSALGAPACRFREGAR